MASGAQLVAGGCQSEKPGFFTANFAGVDVYPVRDEELVDRVTEFTW